jgi:PAS domain S-box-containing protein
MSAEDPCRELLHGRLRRMQNWHRRLRATEREREMIQHTLDAVSLPVAALDAEGTVLFLNAAAEAAFGCSLCSAHGRPGWELLATPEEQAALQGLLARAWQEGEAEGQLTALAQGDGTPQAWSVRLCRAETGAPGRHVILTCWPVEPVKA